MLLIRMRLKSMISSHLAIFLSLVSVSMLGMGFWVGISGSYDSLQSALDTYLDDYGYPDIQLTTTAGINDKLPVLEQLEGVESVHRRISQDAVIYRSDERCLSARFFSHEDGDSSGFYLRDGTLDDGVWIEYGFAKNNHLSVGDIIDVKTENEQLTAKITALVSAPECIKIQQNSNVWGDNTDFGYLYVNRTLLESWFPSALDNQFSLMLKADANQENILKQAKDCLEAYGILDSWIREDSVVQQSITYNTEPLYAMSYLLPPIFFVVMLLTICLFLMQMIQQQRRFLGIYSALGYTGGQSLALFCAYTFTITLFASIAGYGLGHLVMRLVCNIYADSFSMPHFVPTVNITIVVVAVALTIFVGQGATICSVVATLRINPVDAMRGTTPVSGEPPFIVKLLIPTKTPASAKLALSSLLRHKGRLVLSVICIAFSTLLITIAFSFSVSKNALLAQLFDQRATYDGYLLFNAPISEKLLENLKKQNGVSQVEPIVCTALELSVNDKTETVICYGISENSNNIHIPDNKTEMERIAADGDGFVKVSNDKVVLESHLAEKYGVSAGDTVKLNGKYREVSALSRQYVNRIQYGSQKTIEELADLSGANAVTLKIDQNKEDSLRQWMTEQNNSGSVVFTRLLYQNTKQEFQTYDVGVGVVTIFALMMAFVILYNTAQIHLQEHYREYGTMLTLGYLPGYISRILWIETVLKTLLALGIALPFGAEISRVVLQEISTSRREYPFANTWQMYGVVICVMLIFSAISHLTCLRRIRCLNLIESTKVFE